MKRVFIFSVLCFSTSMAACGGQQQKPVEPIDRGVYAMQAIPDIYTTPEDRARFASEHFWDNYPFADTAAVADEEYTEQAVVDYINLLNNIPQEMSRASIPILFNKARVSKEAFLTMAETSEKYLFDPNSPFRNEELYITVLESVLANPALDEYERIRPTTQLTLAKKNRAGTRAADFTYTLASGRTGTMHALKAPWTLLFFNNPGCPACAITIEEMINSAYLTRQIAEGRLKVLALYPDEDLTAWKEHTKDFPTMWINSHDASGRIKSEELYDLKAIPTLYLLDDDKTVVLKDVTSISLIEETINGDN